MNTSMVGDVGSVATMCIASIAYKNCLFLDHMSSLSMSSTRIDGVFVI